MTTTSEPSHSMNDGPKTTPKDFFLWAGAMLSLYMGLFAFVSLIFGYINHTFPDQLLNYYYNDPYQGGISYAMASLIVLTPVFLIVMRIIRTDIRRDPSRGAIWVRRWALFLTLFVAGATIVVDLITVLYTFLSGGELTAAFVLKTATVLLAAAAGFVYFLADLNGYWFKYPRGARLIGYGVGCFVLISVVAGFFIVGTPGQARLYRLDDQKIGDLQTIQYQIVSYWQQRSVLPAVLTDLNDPIAGFVVPVDPQTGQYYSYRATGPLTFELCADFNMPSRSGTQTTVVPRPVALGPDGLQAPGGVYDNWQHIGGAVQTCFERTIDPERYPPR